MSISTPRNAHDLSKLSQFEKKKYEIQQENSKFKNKLLGTYSGHTYKSITRPQKPFIKESLNIRVRRQNLNNTNIENEVSIKSNSQRIYKKLIKTKPTISLKALL